MEIHISRYRKRDSPRNGGGISRIIDKLGQVTSMKSVEVPLAPALGERVGVRGLILFAFMPIHDCTHGNIGRFARRMAHPLFQTGTGNTPFCQALPASLSGTTAFTLTR